MGTALATMHRLLTLRAFSCCRARALGAQASVAAAHGLNPLLPRGSGTQAQWLWCTGLSGAHEMWDLPRPEIKPQTRVSCVGRWTPPLSHREDLSFDV